MVRVKDVPLQFWSYFAALNRMVTRSPAWRSCHNRVRSPWANMRYFRVKHECFMYEAGRVLSERLARAAHQKDRQRQAARYDNHSFLRLEHCPAFSQQYRRSTVYVFSSPHRSGGFRALDRFLSRLKKASSVIPLAPNCRKNNL